METKEVNVNMSFKGLRGLFGFDLSRVEEQARLAGTGSIKVIVILPEKPLESGGCSMEVI
jgi:hypothetical protein